MEQGGPFLCQFNLNQAVNLRRGPTCLRSQLKGESGGNLSVMCSLSSLLSCWVFHLFLLLLSKRSCQRRAAACLLCNSNSSAVTCTYCRFIVPLSLSYCTLNWVFFLFLSFLLSGKHASSCLRRAVKPHERAQRRGNGFRNPTHSFVGIWGSVTTQEVSGWTTMWFKQDERSVDAK